MPKKRRILHVLFSLAAEGCPNMALQMLRQHNPDRYEGAVAYCVEHPDEMRKEFQELGVPMFPLEWHPKGFLPLTARINRVCRTWRPDAIICYTLGMHTFIGLGARLAGIKRVVVHIGNSPPVNRPWQRRMIALELQAGRPFTRYEIACSEHVRTLAMAAYKLPSSRVMVIHNAAPIDDIHRRAMTKRSGREVRPVVGMVARLEQHKDHETLLKAFAIIHTKCPEAILRMVGDGSLRGRLEALCADLGLGDSAQFLGSRRDVPEQLGDMSVFAFATSADEGLGIAIIEALAAEVPVVATDVGACREVLEEGRYGVLVPPHDAQALAEAVLRAFKAGSGSGVAGYAYAQRRFNVAAMTAAYEDALFA